MLYHVFLHSRKCDVWCVFGQAKMFGYFTIRGFCHNNLPARFRNEYPVPELVAEKYWTDFFIFLFIRYDSRFSVGEGVTGHTLQIWCGYKVQKAEYRSKYLRMNQNTLQLTWRIRNFCKIWISHIGVIQNTSTSILLYWAISTCKQLQAFRNRHNVIFKKEWIFNWIATLL